MRCLSTNTKLLAHFCVRFVAHFCVDILCYDNIAIYNIKQFEVN